MATQNYTTIDKYELSRDRYLKLSCIIAESEPHYVVAEYFCMGTRKTDSYLNELRECWHFVGDMAESEASSFYCSMIPEFKDDFPAVDLAKCQSYVAERHFKKEVAKNG